MCCFGPAIICVDDGSPSKTGLAEVTFCRPSYPTLLLYHIIRDEHMCVVALLSPNSGRSSGRSGSCSCSTFGYPSWLSLSCLGLPTTNLGFHSIITLTSRQYLPNSAFTNLHSTLALYSNSISSLSSLCRLPITSADTSARIRELLHS